jgi:signal transduction histidine kinase
VSAQLDGLDPADEESHTAVQSLMRLGIETRRQIAARLHDGPVQVLTAAALRLGMVPRDDVPSREDLEEITALVTRSLMEVRAVMEELRPPSDVGETLGDALRHLAARLGAGHTVEVVEVAEVADVAGGPRPGCTCESSSAAVTALHYMIVQTTLVSLSTERLAQGVRVEVGAADGVDRLRIVVADDDELTAPLGTWTAVLGSTVQQFIEDGRTVLVVDTPAPR